MKGYYKLFEEKKWDLVTETYAEDAQVIWMNRRVLSLTELMKPVLERNKTEMTSDKIDVKWILSDVTGPNSALVTVNYIETADRSGDIRVTDNVGVYLLEQKMGVWKIKKWIPQQNLPLIYVENIDKKYLTGNPASIFKAGGAIGHTWVIFLYIMEHFKKEGLSPAVYDNWNVTREDLFISSQNIWQEIADYMGGVCSLSESGKYWIITMTKKWNNHLYKERI